MSDRPALVYPTDQVVGALPDGARLDDVRDALRDAGVADDAVTVHDHDEGPLAPRAGEASGVKDTVVQAAQKVLGDEAERLHVLEDRLQEGATLVCVAVAAEDDDRRDDEKQRIGSVLREHGAEDVAFYGRYRIEQLDRSAT